MTKKERAKLPLLTVALYAFAEAARERRMTEVPADFDDALKVAFNLSEDEMNWLSRATQFGRGELFTRESSAHIFDAGAIEVAAVLAATTAEPLSVEQVEQVLSAARTVAASKRCTRPEVTK